MKDLENIGILTRIAGKTGLFGNVDTNTSEVAKMLGVSQQSASRKLIELEENGLLSREASANGIVISLNDKSRDLLKDNLDNLKKAFDTKKELKGKLFSGLEEGKYYVGLEGYNVQFEEVLGIKAFPGTMNLKVDTEKLKNFLLSKKALAIEGFSSPERSYGALKAYKVNVGEVKCALVMPDRSHHEEDVVEIISDVKLRDKLGLDDGDTVTIR